MWACYVICAFINHERTQMNLQVGPHTCAHMLNKCDDTPPGPFPLWGCLLLLNLRGWCCSTSETVSIKRDSTKLGEEKKEEERFVKHQSLNDFDRRLILKSYYGSMTFLWLRQKADATSFHFEKTYKIPLPYLCIPWTSPHPQRWHLMVWVVVVVEVGCHWEEQDPAWQFLKEQKGTY